MQTKLQTIFKKSAYWTSVIVVGIIFGLALQFAKAWTEPTSAPPNGNVGAPINTGSATQTKSGALILRSGLTVGNAVDTYSLITMKDNDATNGAKSIYADYDYIGFLNGARSSFLASWDNSGNQINVGNIVAYGYVESYTDNYHYGLLNYGGYGGYFYNSGGVFSENTSGYYTYLDYPGSTWGVLTNGNMAANDYYISSIDKWASSFAGSSSSASYLNATGGTITTQDDYKTHTFTSSGTFTVTNSGVADVLLVAGGGGGGSGSSYIAGGGGGGGGQYVAKNVFLSAGSYSLTVGDGGIGGSIVSGPQEQYCTSDPDSSFPFCFTTYSGKGGTGGATTFSAFSATGGQGGDFSSSGASGGVANGGNGGNYGTEHGDAGNGGNGSISDMFSTATYFGGGGGGGANWGNPGEGGKGGGGNGASPSNSTSTGFRNATSGTTNTGGGGGGGHTHYTGSYGTYMNGASGGSGIVIIRYKYK